MWTVDRIADDLKELGLPPSASVLVHASMRAIGKTENGAQDVVDALLRTVGSDGAIVAPTFTLQFHDPADWPNPPENEIEITRLRANTAVFDAATTPSDQPRMGIFSEVLRTQSGSVRSDHPVFSFTALGGAAPSLTVNAPFHYPLGSESPLARLHNADGWVLLAGVGQEVNSSIHLAEVWASAPFIHRYARVKAGVSGWTTMQGNPGCSDGFTKIEPVLRQARLLHRGYIGNAPSCLIRQRELVSMAIAMIQGNSESLLCDRPTCKECGLARNFTHRVGTVSG